MSLGSKIFRITLFIALSASIFCAVIVYSMSHFESRRSATDTQLLMTVQSLETIDRFFYERYADVQIIARSSAIERFLVADDKGPYFNDADERIQDFLNFYSSWSTMSIFDTTGTILASTEERLEGQSLTAINAEEYAIYQRAIKGETRYSDFFVSTLTGKPAVAFASPVRDMDGRVTGTIIGHIDWNFITEILHANRTNFHLFNGNGVVIARSESEHHVDDTAHLSTINTLVQHALHGHVGGEITKPSGPTPGPETLYTYAQEIGYLDYVGNKWVLVFEQPLKDVFAISWTSAMVLLIFLLGCAAFTIIGILMFKRLLIEPLRALTEVTERFAEGDLTQQAPVSSNDEIGKLAHTFNRMASHIRNSQKELEDKVTERTNSLEEKINELDKLNKYLVGREIKMKELKDHIKELENGPREIRG